jgi:hypothetical protein
MRTFITLLVFFVCVQIANALTPLPDGSPGFFSGEWAGTGAQGAYCYVNMSPEGHGLVLIDNGSGDWLGSRINWRNRQQSLDVEKNSPLPISTQLRIIPLKQFTLSSAFNQSLKLNWNNYSNECNLQKIAKTTNRLGSARNIMSKLPSSKR